MNKLNFLNINTKVILLVVLPIFIFSSCVNKKNTDSTVPHIINLTGIKIEQNQVTVSWAASKDSDYHHTTLSCSNGASKDISGSQSGAISGLVKDTEYIFTLKIVDNSGNITDELTLSVSTTKDSAIDLIIIKTPEQLDSIRNDLAAGYFLNADIDLSEYQNGISWTPIGNKKERFSGIVYGNGHIISNLYINNTEDFQGLFGIINDGKIMDLGLKDVDISANNHTGGLAGHNYQGTILGCYATGTVKGNKNTGILAGINFIGTITDCYAMGKVTGDENTGVLVGHNRGTITDCYSTGLASGNDSTGGLAGYHTGTIADCYSSGIVTGSNDTGGLAGHIRGTITNSYATGSVKGNNDTGGLAGNNHYTKITACFATGSVTGNKNTGGLTGCNDVGTISECFAAGSVTGNKYTGGITGYNINGTIDDCFYDTETTGQNDNSGNGIPQVTSAMLQQATFTGWDFADVWGIDSNINNGYPFFLKNQPD